MQQSSTGQVQLDLVLARLELLNGNQLRAEHLLRNAVATAREHSYPRGELQGLAPWGPGSPQRATVTSCKFSRSCPVDHMEHRGEHRSGSGMGPTGAYFPCAGLIGSPIGSCLPFVRISLVCLGCRQDYPGGHRRRTVRITNCRLPRPAGDDFD